MRHTRRLAAVAAVAVAGVLAWPAGAAQAHPLGNFSVNQYTGLTLRPDRIDVTAAVDYAEIPTLQDKPRVDTDRDGTLSPAELAAHATAECGRLAAQLVVDDLAWTVAGPAYRVTPGAAGLQTSRLECRLSAPADLTEPGTVRVDNGYLADRVGWREMTARGEGVRVDASPLPTTSISDELRSYPRDPLSSSPDARSATIRTGSTGSTVAAQSAATPPGRSPTGPAWLAAAQRQVEGMLGGRLTPVVVALAFLLAILLGAGHAALPGHGKTVMAAYFAGRRGRARDALAVGGTVTIAHTGGVLLVGLLLSTSTALAGERVLAWLGVAAGALVTAVGVGMLTAALRPRTPEATPHNHEHPTSSQHHGDATPDQRHRRARRPLAWLNHGHDHGHGLEHSHRPQHSHEHAHELEHGHEHGPSLEHGPSHEHMPSQQQRHSHEPAHSHGAEHRHGHQPEHSDQHVLAHGHGAEHRHGHQPEHSHQHEHSHEFAHGHGPEHGHGHGIRVRLGGRLGLAGIGLAGGLVPSPSALVVLLGAIGLGRAGLGVLLVLAYGIGMAGTLTAVGLLLVVAQRRLGHLIARGGPAARVSGLLTRLGARVSASAPAATAALVVLVGLGMGVRAVA